MKVFHSIYLGRHHFEKIFYFIVMHLKHSAINTNTGAQEIHPSHNIFLFPSGLVKADLSSVSNYYSDDLPLKGTRVYLWGQQIHLPGARESEAQTGARERKRKMINMSYRFTASSLVLDLPVIPLPCGSTLIIDNGGRLKV